MKWLLYSLLIPVLYVLISLLLSAITVNTTVSNDLKNKSIYLSTNGVHVAVIIPKQDIDTLLLAGLKHTTKYQYLAFSWGDENFYINAPTWGDLTFSNAFKAIFLKSSTLMHVTRYHTKYTNWVEVKVNQTELNAINTYILNTFKTDSQNAKLILENKGYTAIDDFYKAKGSYSCFKTCNSWVNTAFKNSGLKACLWTPFDFGLMHKYK